MSTNPDPELIAAIIYRLYTTRKVGAAHVPADSIYGGPLSNWSKSDYYDGLDRMKKNGLLIDHNKKDGDISLEPSKTPRMLEFAMEYLPEDRANRLANMAGMEPKETKDTMQAVQQETVERQEFEQRIDEIYNRLNEVNERIPANVSATSNAVDDIRNDVEALRVSLEGVPGRLADIEASVDELSSRVNGIENDVEEINMLGKYVDKIKSFFSSDEEDTHTESEEEMVDTPEDEVWKETVAERSEEERDADQRYVASVNRLPEMWSCPKCAELDTEWETDWWPSVNRHLTTVHDGNTITREEALSMIGHEDIEEEEDVTPDQARSASNRLDEPWSCPEEGCDFESDWKPSIGLHRKNHAEADIVEEEEKLASVSEDSNRLSQPWQCSECDYETDWWPSANRHAISRHDFKPRRGVQVTQERATEKPTQVERNRLSETWSCPECDFSTDWNPSVNRHLKAKHDLRFDDNDELVEVA